MYNSIAISGMVTKVKNYLGRYGNFVRYLSKLSGTFPRGSEGRKNGGEDGGGGRAP